MCIRDRPINVASGIKSFGALQLLLDGYCISNNRPLIWDEPENHLHPHWQVEFAKVIVQIVNSGIPVMISTHSPYFLQAVRYYSAMYLSLIHISTRECSTQVFRFARRLSLPTGASLHRCCRWMWNSVASVSYTHLAQPALTTQPWWCSLTQQRWTPQKLRLLLT